jgi:predicted O-methyltransferase YrrM
LLNQEFSRTYRKEPQMRKDKLNRLIDEKPIFHGRKNAGTQQYAISDEVLKWMYGNLESGSITLETGCGYSTIVFALISAHHTVISPFPQEHDLIKNWCEAHDIKIGNIEFIAAPSQEVIHSLGKKGDLDMVLIDGDHAFPAPFIDWYYTADRIKCGGYVIVDDTQLITGKILRDFLLAESIEKRWESAKIMGKTAVFKRMSSSPVARDIPWIHQPYCSTAEEEHND